jgi:hypothetical protein
MNPVSMILESVQKGNITGIVDHALSIRAPPPVREMVNMIMNTIFGLGQGISNQFQTAFAQTTQAPLQASSIPPVYLLVPQNNIYAQQHAQNMAYQQQQQIQGGLYQPQQAQASVVNPAAAVYVDPNTLKVLPAAKKA